MNKKIPLGAAVAFMLVVAGITFCITMMVSLNYFNKLVLNVKEREEMYSKLADADREARQNFDGTIDEETLNNALISGYVRGLGDKYSSYLTKEQYEEKIAEQKGQRISVGLNMAKDATGYMVVNEVIEESSAAEAGIVPGDLIVSIDGQDLTSVSLANATSMLVGADGTKVKVVYRRDGKDTEKELQRKDINMQFIISRMIGTNGYVKISEFNARTHSQFKVAIDALIKQGATALVFDLRDTNSDSLQSANIMLNYLLPRGDLGIQLNKDGSQEVMATSDDYEVNLPMTVLLNAKTGSAAEYFAAVLRDYGKASIVGVQSMGKSVIQELKPLTDGSALNLTVAYFLTPLGTDIAGVGLKPDFEVKLTADQEQNFATLTDDTDPQIRKAIELVNSKTEGQGNTGEESGDDTEEKKE